MLVLPRVVNEEEIFTFKFWLNDTVHIGMSYQGELYCRLESFDLQRRPQVYQLGCKLSRQNTSTVLSVASATCSLWGSLRDPAVKRILLKLDAASLLNVLLFAEMDLASHGALREE